MIAVKKYGWQWVRFWSHVRRFDNDFHEWHPPERKPLVWLASHCFRLETDTHIMDYCSILHCDVILTSLFSLVLCSLWWVQIVGYVLACRSYTFVFTVDHLIIILSKPIWRHLIYKMLVRYILSSVRVTLNIFSQLSIIQYMGLCDFSFPFP